MSSYNSIPNKYNRFILLILMVSPFVGYVTISFAGMDFGKFFTALSYVGVILIFLFANKTNPTKIPTYLWFYILFVLYLYYSAFFQLDGDFKMIYLVHTYIAAINLLIIIENLPINKNYYNRFFKISKKVLIIAIIVIVIQQVYDSNFFTNTSTTTTISAKDMADETESRLDSIYSWVGLQSVGFCFVPIFLLVVEYFNKKKKTKKVLLWILMGIIFAVLSKARWIMLNALLVIAMIVFAEREKFKSALKYTIIVPMILLMSYFTLNTIGINVEGIVKGRILETNKTASNTSATTRILAFKVFDKLYWKNAVFGVGSRKYGMGGDGRHDYELARALGGRSSQIHVGYLMLFYMYGAIGGGLFMLFLYFLMKKMYLNAKKTKMWAPFFGVLGFLLANTTLVHFSFFEFGFLFAVMANKFYVEQKKLELRLTQPA